MIGAILRRAVALVRDGARLPALPPAFAAVAARRHALARRLPRARRPGPPRRDPRLGERPGSDPRRPLQAAPRARALQDVELFQGRRRRAEPSTARSTPETRSPRRGRSPRQPGSIPTSTSASTPRRTRPYAEDESLMVVFPRGPPAAPVGGFVPPRSPAQRDDHARRRDLRPRAARRDAGGADPLRRARRLAGRARCLAALVLATRAPARAESRDDGVYGRLDGDLELRAEAGAAFAAGGPRSRRSARRSYLGTAGIYVHYTDALGDERRRASPDPSRPASTRAALPRALRHRTSSAGPARLDLFLDSFGLEHRRLLGARRAEVASRADPASSSRSPLGVPIFARATGPFSASAAALRVRPARSPAWAVQPDRRRARSSR